MDLRTKFIGLNLNNPLIVSAGPLTGTGQGMVKAMEEGAGAVITKTIVNEVRPNVKPRVLYKEKGLYNIELYSDYSLEKWEQEIAYAKDREAIVIGSILGHSASEITYIGKKVESYGVDAIEMSLFSPHGEGIDGIVDSPEGLYAFTKALTESVNIPVIVKLSANVLNIGKLAREAKRGGAAALSGIDTVRAIPGVNLYTRKALLPTYGGYSGEGIRPIAFAALASMVQATNLPVSGVGGVSKGEHVLEFSMLGADTVQLCSSLMLNGYRHLKTILQELEDLMKNLNIESLDEVRGEALESLLSFEEIPKEPLVAFIKEKEECHHCPGYCQSVCLNRAIIKNNDGYTVDKEKCAGCGLCASVCPDQRISLSYG